LFVENDELVEAIKDHRALLLLGKYLVVLQPDADSLEPTLGTAEKIAVSLYPHESRQEQLRCCAKCFKFSANTEASLAESLELWIQAQVSEIDKCISEIQEEVDQKVFRRSAMLPKLEQRKQHIERLQNNEQIKKSADDAVCIYHDFFDVDLEDALREQQTSLIVDYLRKTPHHHSCTCCQCHLAYNDERSERGKPQCKACGHGIPFRVDGDYTMSCCLVCTEQHAGDIFSDQRRPVHDPACIAIFALFNCCHESIIEIPLTLLADEHSGLVQHLVASGMRTGCQRESCHGYLCRSCLKIKPCLSFKECLKCCLDACNECWSPDGTELCPVCN
jgi:hypothetical protein